MIVKRLFLNFQYQNLHIYKERAATEYLNMYYWHLHIQPPPLLLYNCILHSQGVCEPLLGVAFLPDTPQTRFPDVIRVAPASILINGAFQTPRVQRCCARYIQPASNPTILQTHIIIRVIDFFIEAFERSSPTEI